MGGNGDNKKRSLWIQIISTSCERGRFFPLDHEKTFRKRYPPEIKKIFVPPDKKIVDQMHDWLTIPQEKVTFSARTIVQALPANKINEIELLANNLHLFRQEQRSLPSNITNLFRNMRWRYP